MVAAVYDETEEAGRLEVAKLILAHGADPSTRNTEGELVAAGAARTMNPRIARLLEEAVRARKPGQRHERPTR